MKTFREFLSENNLPFRAPPSRPDADLTQMNPLRLALLIKDRHPAAMRELARRNAGTKVEYIPKPVDVSPEALSHPGLVAFNNVLNKKMSPQEADMAGRKEFIRQHPEVASALWSYADGTANQAQVDAYNKVMGYLKTGQ